MAGVRQPCVYSSIMHSSACNATLLMYPLVLDCLDAYLLVQDASCLFADVSVCACKITKFYI